MGNNRSVLVAKNLYMYGPYQNGRVSLADARSIFSAPSTWSDFSQTKGCEPPLQHCLLAFRQYVFASKSKKNVLLLPVGCLYW
jgi:hypothetical protein